VSDFIEVTLEDGTPVLFQTVESDLVRNHTGKPEVEKASAALGRLKSIALATESISKSLREKLGPDEFEMEIHVGLSGEVGWFFAKADTEASMKVTVRWKSGGAN